MVRAREPSRGFAMRPSRIDMHLGKGGTSDASERMQDIIRTEADIGRAADVHTTSGLALWVAGWTVHSPEVMKSKPESSISMLVRR